MSVIQLLHGTDHIIEVPDIHIGNPHNDYGMGFYCTRVDEMAREWACKKNTDGFVNSYAFDTDGLKVLNLLDEMPSIEGVEAFRLSFTLETAEEVKGVIRKAKAKLGGRMPESVFNPQTDTRGHFNKEII